MLKLHHLFQPLSRKRRSSSPWTCEGLTLTTVCGAEDSTPATKREEKDHQKILRAGIILMEAVSISVHKVFIQQCLGKSTPQKRISVPSWKTMHHFYRIFSYVTKYHLYKLTDNIRRTKTGATWFLVHRFIAWSSLQKHTGSLQIDSFSVIAHRK